MPTTYPATSASEAHVEEAIALASSGDTVTIPAGSATWEQVILPDGVNLAGAGKNQTTITSTLGTNMFAFGDGCTVSDIGFVQADSESVAIYLVLAGDSHDWVLRNCSLTNISGRGLQAGSSNENSPAPEGLVYQCDFAAASTSPATGGNFQLIYSAGGGNVVPPNQNTNEGTLYYDPGFGGSNAVFVENCTFWQDAQGDSTIETYWGAKIVVRHCTGTNFMLGVHGNDSGERSGHIVELYRNAFYNDIGSPHFGTLSSRGGSGVIWENTITSSSTPTANKIVLQSFRSAGRLPASQPDYTLRFPYNSQGQLDGSSPWDGNTPYHATTGTGTHTGADSSTVLTSAVDHSWGVDFYLGDGGSAATNDNLQTYYVWNRTDGSGGFATANTSNTLTVSLTGGTDNTWQSGDVYVITNGYPGLDQIGWVGPTRFIKDTATDTIVTHSTQTLAPWYKWNNTFDGVADSLDFVLDYTSAAYTDIAQPDSTVMIQENREYYNDTEKPNYTPYVYPHPLTGRKPYYGKLTTTGKGSKTSLSGKGNNVRLG